MKTRDTKIIAETFQKIADIVTPTMGAKGRLAIIEQEMDRPLLTDDGVTVARQALSLGGFEKLPAVSMIEAAANTEKEAYDGTTLTVLLTNEFYKVGLKLMKPKFLGGKGMHSQAAADYIVETTEHIRKQLSNKKIALTEPELVRALANITTKIPSIGNIVMEAYKIAGNDMNVVIEHDMKEKETKVEHTEGLVLNSGYMSEVMRQFCTEKNSTTFENAAIVMLSEDLLTQTAIKGFFQSMPNEIPPLVFIVTPNFNPESLKILLDILVQNQKNNLRFQFVFLNEEHTEELFLDIAAYTDGKIQDAALGTSNYLYQHCGKADKIVIEPDKTTIIAKGDVSKRIESYDEKLKDKKFQMSTAQEAMVRRRLSNLRTGLIKIKLGCNTVTEYMTIRLKLDDAIGAVRKALIEGIVPGCGRVLTNIANNYDPVWKDALYAPMKTILSNAGVSKSKIKKYLKDRSMNVYDVKTKKYHDAYKYGIIDGFASVDAAIKNAASIAANYIRSFILIKK